MSTMSRIARFLKIISTFKFVALVLMHPKITRFIAILGIIICSVGYFSIDTNAEKYAIEHNSSVRTAALVSSEIKDICQNVLDETKGSRCYIVEFHNGSYNIAGIPFIKMSETYEVTSNGIANISQFHRGEPIRQIMSWIGPLLNKECVSQSIEYADPVISQVMKEHAALTTQLCPIHVSYMKDPIGYIAVDYTQGYKAAKIEDIESMLRRNSYNVSLSLIKLKG